MRRSICYCEPAQALAGEVNTWNFVYTPASNLPKGTLLKFDLLSEGRPVDWELPETNLKKTQNVIYAKLENGKTLPAREVELEYRFTPQYEFKLPADLEAGESIAVVIGALKGRATQKNGNMAQSVTQRRRNFHLYIDSSGKGHYEDPETFTLDIRGNQLANIRAIAPSYAIKNRRFDIIIRFEDEFGNLTSNASEDTLIELSYENFRENLNWKLFIPETGFITLPNLYFNEEGDYTIHLYKPDTKETFYAPPIKCFPEGKEQMYWGLLHGESERFDSAENIDSCLRYFRDDKSLNFFATSHFENPEETPNDVWRLAVQNVQEFDEAERFNTFLGFQWAGAPHKEGVRQIVYLKDHKQILRKKDAKGSSLKKMYKSFSPKELLSIPCFTMGKGFEYDFKEHSPEFERVVEIYNAWGSSECTKADGNPLPIKPEGRNAKAIKESAEGAVVKALNSNCRFGFVAGGLDDRGIYANCFDDDQMQYSPGLTAIIAQEQTKAALADALYKRSCYATTGKRMIIGFSIAGTKMGEEVSTAEKPGLSMNRHIAGFVAGTENLKTVEIIRNGKVIHTLKPKETYHIDFTYDDLEELGKVALTPDSKGTRFCYYYIRATQEDGHIAWASPIWIDLVELSPSERKARRAARPTKKIAPLIEPIEEFDEEEEEEEEEEDFDIEE